LLFIDESLLIKDFCVGEDAVNELKEEAATLCLKQIKAEQEKPTGFISNKNKVPVYKIETGLTIFCRTQKLCQATL
jgi:hypothetical protein